MTDREKLVELLSEFHCVHVGIEERKVTIEMNAFDIADHLIANGVTVQGCHPLEAPARSAEGGNVKTI